MTPSKPLTGTQRNVLIVASHHTQISQSRLATYPATLETLVQYGYLELVHVPYSEPYYRLTAVGRAALQARE